MAVVNRYNGSPAPGSFYGYQFVVIKVANSNNVFTADTGGADGVAITEGGYAKAVRAFAQISSLIVLSTQVNAAITVIVDAATVNAGPGGTTSGAYGALKDAMASAVGGSASDYTVTTSTALLGGGTFTFA